MRAIEEIPKCPNCGSVLRPNILMFGDFNWISKRTEEQNRRLTSWLLKNRNNKIVIIELGAGISVPTVRYFSETTSIKYNAPLIRINPMDYNTKGIPISMSAKTALEKIDLLLSSSKATL
jgi:NAD-dependent SIR2 family protein deacetylase